jgi:hypothetical protein
LPGLEAGALFGRTVVGQNGLGKDEQESLRLGLVARGAQQVVKNSRCS